MVGAQPRENIGAVESAVRITRPGIDREAARWKLELRDGLAEAEVRIAAVGSQFDEDFGAGQLGEKKGEGKMLCPRRCPGNIARRGKQDRIRQRVESRLAHAGITIPSGVAGRSFPRRNSSRHVWADGRAA